MPGEREVMQVELVSPERILFSGEAQMVIARTLGGGDIAFLKGHAPFIGALGIAGLRIQMLDGSWQHVAVHGGFVEVSDDAVTVLSDVAELASDIDTARAETAKANAGDDADALQRAEVRLAVAAA